MKYPARDWLFLLACFLCAAPVLLSTYPPMVDIPQHAAQVSAIKGIIDGTWSYGSMFEFKPFTPYWLGYSLVLLLAYPFGIVWAVKLIVAAALCMLPWASARFCRRMGANPDWNWMLLLLPLGFAYQWGFLNFIVAAPFGLLFLTALVDLNDRYDWRACVRIALWLHFLFFAHILIAAFFCAVGMLLLASPWNGFYAWMRRCLPIFTILPVAIAWVFVGFQKSPNAGYIVWHSGTHRLIDFLPTLVSSPSLETGQLLGLFVLLVPFLFGYKPKRTWITWTPFCFYVTWMLFFPHDPGGVAFAYQRFGIFGLPLYLICFELDGERSKLTYVSILRIGLILVAGAMLIWQFIRVQIFNFETSGYQAVLEHVEPNKRMLMLAFDHTSKSSPAPLMLHFATWYQAEHNGLVDFNFASNWMQALQYKKEAMPAIGQGFEWNPGSFDWKVHQGSSYEYFLVRFPVDASGWLQLKSNGAIRHLATKGDWQLYGRNYDKELDGVEKSSNSHYVVGHSQ